MWHHHNHMRCVFLQSSRQIRTWNIPAWKKETPASELKAGSGISSLSQEGKTVTPSISQDLQLFFFPRDSITLSLEEQGVFQSPKRNARYLGSMKPFSGSVIGSLSLITFPSNTKCLKLIVGPSRGASMSSFFGARGWLVTQGRNHLNLWV